MAVLKNRAKMSTSTTGTGTITLGSAESGYQTFADAGVANSDIVRYVIEDGDNWEIGTGTYTASGTTLTRTVSESSNSDAALNLSGAAVVFVGATAEDILQPSGGTMTGNLSFGDDDKAIFGTGSDLEIYHDGSNSYISDTSGTGDLYIRGANLRLTDPDGTLFLFGANNSNTRLYFAGAQKLTTTSTGTTINGTLNILPSNAIGSYTLPASDGTAGQVLTTNGSGAITFAATAADATKLPLAGGAMTGAITTNSTFDGRDVSADGTKLDFITVTQAVDLDQMETDIAALANGMVYKGDWDASSGSFPGGGSAQTGWFYYVSVAGTVNSISFAVGDNIIATTDNASTTTYASNWSKHDQTDAVQAVVGLTGSIAKSALLSALNVEDGADVTDTGNVTSAGALMDSEVTNLAQVKAFSSADYATAAQGTLATNALPKAGGTMTGALVMPDGTNALPSFTNTGDLNTGLYFPAADEVGITTGGTQRVKVDSTGVDVTGTLTSDGFRNDTSNTNFNLLARNSSYVAAYIQNAGTGDVLHVRSGDMAPGLGDLHLKVANNGDVSFYEATGTSDSTPKFFWDASAESLGIGTDSPSVELHVKNTSSDADVQIESTFSGGDARLNLYANSTGVSQIRFGDEVSVNVGSLTYSHTDNDMDFRVNGATCMTIDSSGNVTATGTVTATSFSGGGIPTLFVESSGTATAPNSSDSVAIGGYAVSSGTNSTALGRANAGGTDSFAAGIGSSANTLGAQGSFSVSIGTLSKATALASTAVGYGALSTHAASSAFGTSATTTATNQIALGGSGVTARISGAYNLPTADGTANQVLTTDGSGAVTFATAAGGGSSGLPIALSIVFGR